VATIPGLGVVDVALTGEVQNVALLRIRRDVLADLSDEQGVSGLLVGRYGSLLSLVASVLASASPHHPVHEHVCRALYRSESHKSN
jgi:hypothetical protein